MLMCLALIACAQAPRSPGLEVAEPSALPRIVSLNPCLDAILVEVAAPQQILALSHYSHDPSASSIPQSLARKYPITGGTAEEVFALQPDLVLASSFIAPATKRALERLDLRVETFGGVGSFDESIAQIEQIAALARREAQGRCAGAALVSGSRTPGAPATAPITVSAANVDLSAAVATRPDRGGRGLACF